MIDRAAQALLNAKTSAEVLEAKEMAGFVYDAAKRSARLSKAKDAHDSLIAAAHRAQADALDIEAQAKRRLADEYDAAQERGEVGQSGARTDLVPKGNEVVPPASAAGLSRKTIHEARQVRDAEAAEPGIVRRTLDDKLSRGEEPTRAALREVVTAAAVRGMRAEPSTGRKNPLYEPPTPAGSAWAHLYGSCGRMLEWATDEKIRLAIEGLAERTDDQAANLREVREWAARLNQIVEMIDAE
ncbi:hypothetical protein D9R14_07665 [Xanthobacter tagetidis]|uniref:Uncharacterized protein n=2 Tax=Xanthobacter tagetidis TaxID=60216 RepID=A0A3L7AIW7_9HYPH|nr:hypothetical protein D9R14_07665 [Xanthobacter tagetidis]